MKKVLEISGLGQETYLPDGPPLQTRSTAFPDASMCDLNDFGACLSQASPLLTGNCSQIPRLFTLFNLRRFPCAAPAWWCNIRCLNQNVSFSFKTLVLGCFPS